MTDHAHRAAYLDGQADETDDPALAEALRTRAEREREQAPRPTLQHLRDNGHRFTPDRWQRGSASPGCQCGHDFGRVGGTLTRCREMHTDHLRDVQKGTA